MNNTLKLLVCAECKDVVAIMPWTKRCKCRASLSKLLKDKETIEVLGPCRVVEVSLLDFRVLDEPNILIRRVRMLTENEYN